MSSEISKVPGGRDSEPIKPERRHSAPAIPKAQELIREANVESARQSLGAVFGSKKVKKAIKEERQSNINRLSKLGSEYIAHEEITDPHEKITNKITTVGKILNEVIGCVEGKKIHKGTVKTDARKGFEEADLAGKIKWVATVEKAEITAKARFISGELQRELTEQLKAEVKTGTLEDSPNVFMQMKAMLQEGSFTNPNLFKVIGQYLNRCCQQAGKKQSYLGDEFKECIEAWYEAGGSPMKGIEAIRTQRVKNTVPDLSTDNRTLTFPKQKFLVHSNVPEFKAMFEAKLSEKLKPTGLFRKTDKTMTINEFEATAQKIINELNKKDWEKPVSFLFTYQVADKVRGVAIGECVVAKESEGTNEITTKDIIGRKGEGKALGYLGKMDNDPDAKDVLAAVSDQAQYKWFEEKLVPEKDALFVGLAGLRAQLRIEGDGVRKSQEEPMSRHKKLNSSLAYGSSYVGRLNNLKEVQKKMENHKDALGRQMALVEDGIEKNRSKQEKLKEMAKLPEQKEREFAEEEYKKAQGKYPLTEDERNYIQIVLHNSDELDGFHKEKIKEKIDKNLPFNEFDWQALSNALGQEELKPIKINEEIVRCGVLYESAVKKGDRREIKRCEDQLSLAEAEAEKYKKVVVPALLNAKGEKEAAKELEYNAMTQKHVLSPNLEETKMHYVAIVVENLKDIDPFYKEKIQRKIANNNEQLSVLDWAELKRALENNAEPVAINKKIEEKERQIDQLIKQKSSAESIKKSVRELSDVENKKREYQQNIVPWLIKADEMERAEKAKDYSKANDVTQLSESDARLLEKILNDLEKLDQFYREKISAKIKDRKFNEIDLKVLLEAMNDKEPVNINKKIQEEHEKWKAVATQEKNKVMQNIIKLGREKEEYQRNVEQLEKILKTPSGIGVVKTVVQQFQLKEIADWEGVINEHNKLGCSEALQRKIKNKEVLTEADAKELRTFLDAIEKKVSKEEFRDENFISNLRKDLENVTFKNESSPRARLLPPRGKNPFRENVLPLRAPAPSPPPSSSFHLENLDEWKKMMAVFKSDAKSLYNSNLHKKMNTENASWTPEELKELQKIMREAKADPGLTVEQNLLAEKLEKSLNKDNEKKGVGLKGSAKEWKEFVDALNPDEYDSEARSKIPTILSKIQGREPFDEAEIGVMEKFIDGMDGKYRNEKLKDIRAWFSSMQTDLNEQLEALRNESDSNKKMLEDHYYNYIASQFNRIKGSQNPTIQKIEIRESLLEKITQKKQLSKEELGEVIEVLESAQKQPSFAAIRSTVDELKKVKDSFEDKAKAEEKPKADEKVEERVFVNPLLKAALEKKIKPITSDDSGWG